MTNPKLKTLDIKAHVSFLWREHFIYIVTHLNAGRIKGSTCDSNGRRQLKAQAWSLLDSTYAPFPFTEFNQHPLTVINCKITVFLSPVSSSGKSLSLRVILETLNIKLQCKFDAYTIKKKNIIYGS